jgi:hypothetical protein
MVHVGCCPQTMPSNRTDVFVLVQWHNLLSSPTETIVIVNLGTIMNI